VLGDFDPDAAENCLRQIANPAPLYKVSAKTGTGMDAWLDWIRREAGSRE
jgi:hydrogenase nickel incorporation protein HypB